MSYTSLDLHQFMVAVFVVFYCQRVNSVKLKEYNVLLFSASASLSILVHFSLLWFQYLLVSCIRFFNCLFFSYMCV